MIMIMIIKGHGTHYYMPPAGLQLFVGGRRGVEGGIGGEGRANRF
jgi:hypothetical protein